jgi:DNA-binding XRE family transcriptional regulator
MHVIYSLMAKPLPKQADDSHSVEAFQKVIGILCPKASIRMEPGGDKAGNVWIDVAQDGNRMTAEWRPGLGMGLYGPEESAYGSRPREVFQDVVMAARRVRQLLAAREPGPLQIIRDLLDLSQAEVAKKLSVRQAAVSRIEKRQDPKLQSLIKNVQAMGGELEVRVRLPGGEFAILRTARKTVKARSSKKGRETVHA